MFSGDYFAFPCPVCGHVEYVLVPSSTVLKELLIHAECFHCGFEGPAVVASLDFDVAHHSAVHAWNSYVTSCFVDSPSEGGEG